MVEIDLLETRVSHLLSVCLLGLLYYDVIMMSLWCH